MASDLKFERQRAPISLELACSALEELWSPQVVGQVNNQYIKVARIYGEFPWHSHEHEDEMSPEEEYAIRQFYEVLRRRR